MPQIRVAKLGMPRPAAIQQVFYIHRRMSAELEAVEGQIIEDILRMMVPEGLPAAVPEIRTPLFQGEAVAEEVVA